MQYLPRPLAASTRYAALAVSALALVPVPAGAEPPTPDTAVNTDTHTQPEDPAGEAAQHPGHTFTDFTDFTDEDHNVRWRSVNDNVMGGRSRGNFAFEDGVMTFAGAINTNGGGFASVRFQLDPNTLLYTPDPDTPEDRAAEEPGETQAQPIPYTRIQFRIKTDGRPYRLLLADDTRYQRRNISHRALLIPPTEDNQVGNEETRDPENNDPDHTEQSAPDEDGWQTVTIPLDALAPTWRGRTVPGAPPFDPARATTLGITLVDDTDGPFALHIKSITFLP